MKLRYVAFVPWLVLSQSLASSNELPPGQSPDTQESVADSPGIAMNKIIDVVARKTGKKFLIDPKVHAQVQLIGEDFNRITYPEMLTILQLYGFTAVESGGYVLVVPDTNIRMMPVRELSGKETAPDSEFVSVIIPVKTLPAVRLVPILRPLLPPYAHLAAEPCSNSFLMADTYANVRKIENLVKALDTGSPFTPTKCEAPGVRPDGSTESKSP